MKWYENEHDMLRRKICPVKSFPYAFLLAILGSLMNVFRQTSKHENCRILSLVSIGILWSFIAIMVCEIWPV